MREAMRPPSSCATITTETSGRPPRAAIRRGRTAAQTRISSG